MRRSPPIRRAARLALASLCLLSPLLPACVDGGADDELATSQAALDQTPFEQIRDLEPYFDLPAESQVATVGTFNAATGEFTGLVTTTEEEIGPDGNWREITIVPIAHITAIRAVLRFDVINATTGSTLTLGGETYTIPPSGSVQIDVGLATQLSWSIRNGSRTYSDQLKIARNGVFGAGGITLEAVPVAVVYEPSQPGGGSATATFGLEQTVASTLSMSSATSSLDRADQYYAPHAWLDSLGAIATATGKKEIAAVCDGLRALMGSTTVIDTVEVKESTEHDATFMITQKQSYTPTTRLGPGHGDVIVVAKDVQVVFALNGGHLTWTIVGGRAIAGYSADTLRADLALLQAGGSPSSTTSGLSLEAVQSLLALDPFVAAGETAYLPGNRFSRLSTISGSGVDQTLSLIATTTTSDTSTRSTVKTHQVDTSSSLATMLGWSDPVHHTSSTTSGHATTDVQQTSVSSSITVSTPSPYDYQVFYDRLWGTFVARTAMPVPDRWNAEFADAGGWATNPGYWSTIRFPDVDGDGRADVCGRGEYGVVCGKSNDLGFGTVAVWQSTFSDAKGWKAPEYYRTLRFPDLDGDGKADVCARGAIGVWCALSTGSGFGSLTLWTNRYSNALGWNSTPAYYDTIEFPDGDGKADVCGRGATGVECALGNGTTGFGTGIIWAASFSDANGWASTPAYWSTLRYGDVDGDGKDDLCGRGGAGMYCALSTGTSFGAPTVWASAFSNASGWLNATSQYATLQLADLDADGKADLCGRGSDGLRCGRSTGASFSGASAVVVSGFSDTAGWNLPMRYRSVTLVDVDLDGKADACGRDATGVVCAPSTSTSSEVSFAALRRVVDGFDDDLLAGSTAYSDTLRPANVQTSGGVEWCARTSDGIRCSERP